MTQTDALKRQSDFTYMYEMVVAPEEDTRCHLVPGVAGDVSR